MQGSKITLDNHFHADVVHFYVGLISVPMAACAMLVHASGSQATIP